MRRRFAFLLLLGMAIILAMNAPVLPQGNKLLQIQDSALDQIPLANRARLAERLELYISSLIKGKFSDAYDLTADGCKYGLRKEEWLKKAHYEGPGQLQKFILKEAYTGDYSSPEILPGEKWIIAGCGVYRVGNESISYDSSYSVMLMNGEWYICDSGVKVEGKEKTYARCSE
jgi:hypothetical protein